MKLATLVFWLCFSETCCSIEFVHLCGYLLNSDLLICTSANNEIDCAAKCGSNDDCQGFMFESLGCCFLNYIKSVTATGTCAYYIRKSSDYIVQGRSLNEIDQLIQNVAYSTQEACPLSWSINTDDCSLSVPISTCNEYASFFDASFINDTCILPLMKPTFYCPNSSWALGTYSDGSYCHMMIPRFTTLNNQTYVDACIDECERQTGGTFATIHSAAENDFINNLQVNVTNPGQAIGLLANNSATGMTWYDNSVMSFTNGLSTTATTTNFQLTILIDGAWQTALPNIENSFHYIACKKDAVKIYQTVA